MPDIKFFEKLKSICSELQMRPEDLLLIMTMESSISGTAVNPSTKATGLIQFMPSTLKRLGFTDGVDKFKDVDEVKQLDYVKSYIQGFMGANGGPFKSATRLYVAVLYPIALGLKGVRNDDMNAAIMSKDGSVPKYKALTPKNVAQAYNLNSNLDTDKDGIITYGDLNRKMESLKHNKKYQEALLGLRAVDGQTKEPDSMVRTESDQIASSDRPDLSPTSSAAPSGSKGLINDMFDSLSSMWKAFAGTPSDFGTYIVKVAGQSDLEVLEYSRVLKNAIESNLECRASVHHNKSDSEIIIECDYDKDYETFVKQANLFFTKEFNKKYNTNIQTDIVRYTSAKLPLANDAKIEKAFLYFRKK